jgi:hypothetical protein
MKHASVGQLQRTGEVNFERAIISCRSQQELHLGELQARMTSL